MVTLQSRSDSSFDCKASKIDIKKALKAELFNSFCIKEDTNVDAMTEYLIDNFFWEFLSHFREELIVLFGMHNTNNFGGELL